MIESHNTTEGADDKHSLSEEGGGVVGLLFFFLLYPGEQRRRGTALHHINKLATAQMGRLFFSFFF